MESVDAGTAGVAGLVSWKRSCGPDVTGSVGDDRVTVTLAARGWRASTTESPSEVPGGASDTLVPPVDVMVTLGGSLSATVAETAAGVLANAGATSRLS